MPEIQIHRYENALFALDTSDLAAELDRISGEFRFFLGEDYKKSANLDRLRNYLMDPFIREVADDCNTILPDLSGVKEELAQAFRHYLYYFPGASLPEIYTYISGFDLENRVTLVENNLIIAIDTYLGRDYQKYGQFGIPFYRARAMDPAYLVTDCLRELGKQYIHPDSCGYNLLEQSVYEGKILLFAGLLAPDTPDTILMKYTTRQLEWAADNEYNVWAFIIENNFLYSSDIMMTRKMISDGPFTSYFGEESAPRPGGWFGWKIVKGYYEKNPGQSVRDLLQYYDAQKILSGSAYKPPRPS
ncbi:MAG: hypothetical protein JXA03_01205 [Bacteroidales bacterium]|nr:hypothetical protein [Bacteroidales bacterium]